VAAGDGMPDVIVEDRPQLPHIAAQGIEQNLQPYIDRDGLDPARFWPFTWEQTLYEGDSYGLPFETDVRVLFYNKTLFEEAGLDPDTPPATWDQLWEYAAALDVVNADGSYERMGFFPLFGNVGIDAWAQTAGHVWVPDDLPVVDDPVVADTLAWLKTWVERYGGYDAVEDFRSLLGPAPNDAFMTGKVAMIVDISSYNSILNFYRPQITLEDGSTVNVEWGVALIPYLTQPSSVSGGFALSIPSGAAQTAAAWEFIKCATSPAAQVSWARDTYAIPSDIAAASDPLLMVDPEWQFFVTAMEYSTAGAFVPAYSGWREQLQQRLEPVWRGELSIEDALAEAQAAIDAVIAQNP
jgi:multiple sugar transport system substrate-binding protein